MSGRCRSTPPADSSSPSPRTPPFHASDSFLLQLSMFHKMSFFGREYFLISILLQLFCRSTSFLTIFPLEPASILLILPDPRKLHCSYVSQMFSKRLLLLCFLHNNQRAPASLFFFFFFPTATVPSAKNVFSPKNVRLPQVVHAPADGPVLSQQSQPLHTAINPPGRRPPTSENRFALRDSAGSAAIQFGSNLIFTSLNCSAEVVQ